MRLALFDPAVALSLDPQRILEIFRARRAEMPVTPAPDSASASASSVERARALFVSPVPDDVALDLWDLERFATPAGVRALVEAARAAGRDVTKWPLDEPPASVVARFIAARVHNEAFRAVWARARIRLNRALAEVPTYELRAPSPRAAVAAAEAGETREERLRDALRAVLGKDLADVFLVEDESTGDLHAAVLFLGAHRSAAMRTKSGAFGVHEWRPVESIGIAYDAGAGRLRVRTAAPEHLLAIAAALGKALWNDARYFSDRPSLTFKPLSRAGEKLFESIELPAGVVRVSCIAAQVDTVQSGRIEARGPKPLDALEARGAREGGYVTRVTLRIDVRGEDLPVDAFLQLPYRFDVSERRHERLVREVVAALGFTDPGALPDDSWTLAPFVHPEWRFVEVLGEKAFRALVAAGLLAKKKGARVAGEAFRKLGASYVTFEVPGEPGVRYALSEDRTVPAKDVREEELIVWELDTAKLAAKMRAELGTQPAERELEGVVDLGYLTLGASLVRILHCLRGPGRNLAAAATKGAAPVLLAPAGRPVSDGLSRVELTLAEQLGVDGIGHLVGKIAALLAIEDVEPWRLTDAPVVVERKTQRVWILGILMTALADRSYRMLEFLALHAGQIVPPKELAEHVARNRGNLAEVVKKVRPDLLRRIEESFRAAGVAVPEELLAELAIVEGKRGYRMALRAYVV